MPPLSDLQETLFPLGKPRPCGYFMEYPTAGWVEHYTRSLAFEERLSVISQGFHRGAQTVRCYSLEEFAMALGKRVDSDPAGGIRSLDWKVFLPWLQNVIGDKELYNAVKAIRENCPSEEETVETLRVVLFVRLYQYKEVTEDQGGRTC